MVLFLPFNYISYSLWNSNTSKFQVRKPSEKKGTFSVINIKEFAFVGTYIGPYL